MSSLQVTTIISLTTMVLLTALLYLIRTMPTRPGIGWWISASITGTLIYAFGLVFSLDAENSIGILYFYVFSMGGVACLSIGTLLFTNSAVRVRRQLMYLTLAIVLVVSLVIERNIFLASLVVGSYNGLYMLYLAYKIFSYC